MPKAIAQIPELITEDKEVYVLNWLGRARETPGEPGKYQVFVRLLNKKNSKVYIDRWLSFQYFPFFILGSEWRKGIMVGKPLGSRFVPLDIRTPPTWRMPSKSPRDGHVCFGEGYGLAFDMPASPVLELATSNREILYAPLSEVLRAHYFFCPKALPSLLGGLDIYKRLAVEKMRAWMPAETRWIDLEGKIAKIYREHFIDDEDAKRLARLLFDPMGKKNLAELHHWIQANFIRTVKKAPSEKRADLPRLTLPYAAGGWNVVTRTLSPVGGRNCSLVLQINSFEAPEPYKVLLVEADLMTTQGGSTGGEGGEGDRGGAQVLKPKPPPELPVEDGDSDGGLTPVSLEDIRPVDKASRRRKPVKPERPKPEPGNQGPHQGDPVPVGAGSGNLSGPGGKGRAPTAFKRGDDWPQYTDAMRSLAMHIRDAVQSLVDQHRNCGISAECSLLPSDHRVYCYSVPKSDSKYAEDRAPKRQFIVLAVRIANRYAYVIEPEQRLSSDSFPLGALATREGASSPPSYRSFTTAHIEQIAVEFESAFRQGRSWLKAKDLLEGFICVAVRHGPREKALIGDLDGFKRRIVDAVAALIGDASVLAQISSSPKKDAAG